MTSMSKIKVMHVIASSAIGGTERMLMYSIPAYSTERFDMKIVSLVDPSYLTEDFAKAGITLEHLNAPRARFSFKAFFRLRTAIKSWLPDIVFTYGQRSSLAAKMCKWSIRHPFKLICGQRNCGDIGGKSYVWIERLTRFVPDLYISNSQTGADFLFNRVHLSPQKVVVIPNGIDFDIPDDVEQQAMRLKRDYRIPDGSFIVGSIGRLYIVKGHEYLIRAMPEILRTIPEAVLVLVGEDRMNGSLQKIVEKLDLSDKVIFAGLSRSVAAWHKVFDVFVLPSLSEATSTAAIEAMFSSLPIIATNIGGNPDVIADGKTGVLVPSRSPDAIAKAVIELYHSPALQQQLATAGLERAQANYNLTRMLNEYEAIFEKLP